MRRFYEANVLNKDNFSAFYGFSNSYLTLYLIFVLCFCMLDEEHVTIELWIQVWRLYCILDLIRPAEISRFNIPTGLLREGQGHVRRWPKV